MSFIDRLHNEKPELRHKLTSLEKFMGSDEFKKLDHIHQILLCQQAVHMASYITILETRLHLLEKSDAEILQDQWRDDIRTRLQPDPVITGTHHDEPPEFTS